MAKLHKILPILACLTLLSCTPQEENINYKDGTFTGESQKHEADEDGVGAGYATCTITISDNTIVACEISLYELDGTLKDENYGKEYSQDNYIKAQKAVQAANKYAPDLLKYGNLKDVDVISGATITYSEFKEAVDDALNKAKV